MRPFYPYASNYRSLSGPIEWYQTQISGIIGVFGTENGPNGPHGSTFLIKEKGAILTNHTPLSTECTLSVLLLVTH